MRVSDHDVTVAEYIVDTSGIIGVLADAMRTSPRGRRQNTDTIRQLLIGLFLCAHHHRTAKLTMVHEVLTRGISLESQLRLGVAVTDPSLPEGHRIELSLHRLKYVSRVFGRQLAVTDTEGAERARRLETLQAISDRVMDVFDLGFTSDTFALDATAIWSWGRGYRLDTETDDGDRDGDDTSSGSDATDVDDTDNRNDSGEDGNPSTTPKKRRRLDPDARWGVKTGKDGKPQPFYGYDEHTLLQVPAHGQDTDAEPRLIRRFTITPAAVDVVEPSLALIDRSPVPVRTLIVDRHYSYRDPDRWWDELHDRDIRQVLDLRSDDQGFTEVDRMRLAAGALHCPATPDTFGTIERPAPATATKADYQEFHRRIRTRAAYLMRRITRPDRTGKHRVQCCAKAGTVGCPLQPGTIEAALALGLPVVENPPDPNSPEGLPACCTQSTVTVTPPGKHRKLMQDDYWGSKPWETKWNKRTYVEGSYGNRKNSSTEDLRRGMFAVVGLHWITLVMTMINASYDLRLLRNWHDRTGKGDPNHPLLRAAPETYLVELTPAEAASHIQTRRTA